VLKKGCGSIEMADKEVIKNNFSRYAKYYDRYSNVQHSCALELISKIKTNGFKKILDIGCGTGNYTKYLRAKFPLAQIKALDISSEMIEVAREKLEDKEIEFIIADGESINFEEKFDLISSNASFQWFEDLRGALLRYKRLLNRRGVISFSTFGPNTFYELNQSLREMYRRREVSLSSRNFPQKTKIEKILKVLFGEVEVERKIHKEKYNLLSELLRKIKYSGVRGRGMGRKTFWTPGIIEELQKVYKDKFKGITVTYEIFFCRGVR